MFASDDCATVLILPAGIGDAVSTIPLNNKRVAPGAVTADITGAVTAFSTTYLAFGMYLPPS